VEPRLGRQARARNDLDRAEHRLILSGGEAGSLAGLLPRLDGVLVVHR
jgi:hypothetical protein